MGKMSMALLTLICIDILFLVTGQLGEGSASSFIITSITDPSSITLSSFWSVMIGEGGLGSLVVAAGITLGAFLSATNVIVFLPMGILLAALIGDYLTIFNLLKDSNPILATMVMVPIMMIFIFTIVEWVRAKD